MGEGFKPRRYACIRWPFLRLRHLQFCAGFLTVNSQEDADLVESNDAYGVHVHPVLWEPERLPSKPGKVETLIESEIEAALIEKKPKARKGAVGTK